MLNKANKPVKWLRPGKVIFIMLAYAVIIVLMTWPALDQLNERLIGKSEDTWIFFWNNWWLGQVLTGNHDLFQTSFIFYPEGTSLIAHSSSFLNSFLAFLLEPLTGPAAAYNLVLLIGLWLGAIGMYILVKDITGHTLGSFLAGFVFAFAPYHITQVLAHDHLSSIHWWPFFALFFRRALIDGRLRDAFLAGLFGAFSVWSGLQLGLLLAIWALAYITWFLWQQRAEAMVDRQFFKKTASRSGLIALVILLLSAPILWAIVTNWSTVTTGADAVNEGFAKQTDLLAYLIPPDVHPIFADQVLPLLERFGYSKGFTPYIGFGVIALSFVAVLGWRKEARFWFITLGLWLLMAAGSALRFNGQVYEQLALPFRWLGALFPLSTIRAPDRFNLLMVFSLAVLAGLGAAYLAQKRRWRWVLLPLSFLIVIEYLIIPMPMLDLPPGSPFLDVIAADEANYAIIDYPLSYNDSKFWIYYQTLHGKPIVEGHVSRYSTDTYEFIKDQPLLNVLYDRSTMPPTLPADYFQAQTYPRALGPELRELNEAGFRYILLHRPFVNEQKQTEFESNLPLVPIYQDNVLTVYDLAHPQLKRFGPPSAPLSPEIELIQATTNLDSSERLLEISLLTQVKDQVDEVPVCQLRLPGTSAAVFFKALPAQADWQAGDLAIQTVDLPIPSELSDSRYNWQINCPDTPAYTGSESLYFEDDNLSLFNPELNLQYEDAIAINGHRQWIQQSDLHLILRWQAQADIDINYKVFIHLIDEAGRIVRQHDALHCNWACPSSQWTAGQTIVDETTIPLLGLPVGEYQLAFGLYNESSGERLPVRDAAGQLIPDAVYILEDTISIPGGP